MTEIIAGGFGFGFLWVFFLVFEWFPCMESLGWCCFRWLQQCQGHWWWKFCTVFPHCLENCLSLLPPYPPQPNLCQASSCEQNFSARWIWIFTCSVEQDTQIQLWEGHSWGVQDQNLSAGAWNGWAFWGVLLSQRVWGKKIKNACHVLFLVSFGISVWGK